MYKMRKVFDIHYSGMPDNVIEVLRETYEVRCNGCYFNVEVVGKTFLDEADDGTETVVENEEYSELHAWLVENGAYVGENVLILYWW